MLLLYPIVAVPAGMRVRRHGCLHVGTAAHLLLLGLSVAFNVFACPVGWQRGGERGGAIHRCNVCIRVGTKFLPSGLIVRRSAYPPISMMSSYIKRYPQTTGTHVNGSGVTGDWHTHLSVNPRAQVSTRIVIPEMFYDQVYDQVYEQDTRRQ